MKEKDISPLNEYAGYAKNIAFVAVAQVLVSLLQFIRLPLLTNLLGVTLYGVWSLIWSAVVLIAPVATLGLTMAMIRFLAAEKDASRVRSGYLSMVFAVLAAAVLIAATMVLCSDTFAIAITGNAESVQLIKLASIMTITQAISQMSIAFFRTFRQMKWYSTLLVIKSAAELGLMAVFLSLHWEIGGLIIAVAGSDVLCIAIALSFTLKQIGFEFPKFTHLQQYLAYGLPLTPNGAILWLMLFSNRYIIGYFMGPADVGIYTAAYTLVSIISLFMGPLQTVLFPTISKSYEEGEINRTRNYLKYSMKYLMLFSIPAVFGISALASPLLLILTTPEFISGSAVVPLIALGILFYNYYQACIYIVYLLKKTYLEVILLSIAAILNIGLNLLLVPLVGIVGAGVASLITYGSLGIATIIICSRYLKFDLNVIFLSKSISASTVMAVAVLLISPEGIPGVILSIILGIIIYVAVMVLLRSFDRAELIFLRVLVVDSIRRRKAK